MTDLKLPQLSYLTLKKRPAHYAEPDWHWYYAPKKSDIDWKPLSIKDSNKIESEFKRNAKSLTLIAIEGNRYDISIGLRKRYSVYWDSEPTCIRRCLWFYKVYKHLDYSPFEESVSEKLEQEYRNCVESNRWNVKIQLADNKGIVDICAPDEVYHYYSETNSTRTDKNIGSFVYKPTIVRRGFKGVKFTLGESDDVDHLLFIVHGIGPGCDLKFHTIAEVVDEFRTISYQLIDSHYQLSIENGLVNRIEILPISWYHELHSEYTDQKLREITLKSMPRLRDFTNSTLLDILFYTSPVYAQKISNTVGNEMNRLSNLFRQRNGNFSGSISLGGHSLGSLIIFDILCHQKSARMRTCTKKESDIKMKPQLRRRMSKMMGYALGVKGAGQPRISYPQLNFEPNAFFALGSPIAMFVSIRGIDFLGENFSLPTCKSFFNIFHPYDPIAYRLEPLINSTLKNINPVLIPHHKGRKRMHLEVKEMMYRLGSDVRQMLYDTWSNMTIPTLINRILNQSWSLRHKNEASDENGSDAAAMAAAAAAGESFLKIDQADPDDDRFFHDSSLGSLNNGRRIDYTLQEAPIEILNEYIFAFQSHVCYWDSHDTVLLIINEIYNSLGIVRDNNDNIQEEI